MKRLALFLALVLLATGSTGCFGRGGAGAAIFATGLVVGAVLSADRHPEHTHVTNVYYSGPAVPTPDRGGGSWRDRVPEPSDERPAFDAKGARIALAKVDFTSCAAAGVPTGYGHARVTFNPSGDISKVVVDEPAGLSPAAAKCIGDRLGTTTVPEFRGSLVTVGTTWFVP